MTKKQARKKKHSHGKNNKFCPNCRTLAKLTRFNVCIRCVPQSETPIDLILNAAIITSSNFSRIKNELKNPKIL